MTDLAASERTPCERCGTFAELSEYDGHAICEDCLERLSEIERTPPTLGNVLQGSLWVLSKIGLPAALIVAVADLPMALFEVLAPEVPAFVSTAWGATVSILAQGVVLHLAHRAIRGGPFDLPRSGRRTMDAAGNLIVSNFLAGLQIFLFTLLLIVPGIVRGLSLTLVLPIALHEDARSNDVLRASTERMKGHRVTALLAYLVWGSAWLLFFAAYLGFSFALEMEELAGLTDGMVTLLLVGGGVLMPVLMVPVVCTTAVLYAKTLKYRVY